MATCYRHSRRRAPKGRPGHEQAADAEDGDRKEVHDEDGGPRVEAGQQRDGAGGVPAAQAQVVEAGAPHLLVRRAALVAEHLRMRWSFLSARDRQHQQGLPGRLRPCATAAAARLRNQHHRPPLPPLFAGRHWTLQDSALNWAALPKCTSSGCPSLPGLAPEPYEESRNNQGSLYTQSQSQERLGT